LVQFPKYRVRFAESEVSPPACEVPTEFGNHATQAHALRAAGQPPHFVFEALQRGLRHPSLVGRRAVKLNPRNFRFQGRSTALFASLTLSFRTCARYFVTLANTRCPALRLRT